ncbi:MAG: AMP-binding protein [Rhodobiaceae bacterium]|nr:AMP-binding protein [Rhodobiaceae bacterium]MCC0049920.1 AMP-binding protein [Rhodobiaceae bacterium]
MLQRAQTYSDLVSGFRWRIPERFNIGVATTDAWATKAPDRVAILNRLADGGVEQVTYGELANRSSRLASSLAAAGIAAGDRVAILLPQCPQTPISHAAVYKLGAIAVPLALLFGPDALAYRLENSGAKCVITCAQGLERLREIETLPDGLKLIVSTDGASGRAVAFDDLITKGSENFTPADTGPDDPALMIYTSGTTGQAKGALHGHRVLLGHIPGVQMTHEFLPQEGDILWTPADWAWAGGLLNILLPGLLLGVPVVAARWEKFDPEAAFALMEQMRVRNAFIPPTALKMMRAVENPSARYKLNLRTVGSGGESLGRETYDWARAELGLTINEFYGQTECNLVLSSCAEIGVSRSGAIGKTVPGHEVAIVGADGDVLPAGKTGQIAVRRPDPVMFLQYWDNPEATEAKFIGDWMLTGDQGMSDDDGYIFFVGRDDDVITSSGYRIGPGEVEDCLLTHPAVALAAAVGKPDPVRTEIVKAFIVLKPGHKPSDELASEIQAWVRQRLAAHEYPREITFRNALPLTTTGKVIRRLLREEA